MRVLVNGKPTELQRGATVAAVLASLDLPDRVAEVVPRGEWETTMLDDGARVEVLRAIQGG